MRRHRPHLPPSRLLTGLLVPAMLAAGGAAEAESDPLSEKARDAVGILADNQDRCLKLSYGKLDILEGGYPQDEQTEEVTHYLKQENATSVRVAKKALGLARRLARDFERGSKDRTSTSILGMLGSQEDLCQWAIDVHSWNDADVYRQQIREQLDKFADAQSSLPSNLQLDSSERREVIQRYRQQLYDTGDEFTDEAIESAIDEDGTQLDDDAISDDEYRRKQKEYAEWLAEQERREAAKMRRFAQRRKEMQERRKQEPRDMPRLELKQPEQKPAVAVDPEAMVAWHADYNAKIAPFKQSLSQYLKVRAPTRTLIMFNACVELARTSGKLLQDPTALVAPDPQVTKPLRQAVRHFKVASDACVNNRLKTTRDSMTAGEQSLREAIKALKPYELGL